MKNIALSLLAMIGLSSCAEFDAKLKAKTGLDTAAILTLGLSAKFKAEQLKSEYETLKTGLDTAAILTLGLSAKLKAEQLKSEYETLKAVEVTAQK